MRVFVTTLVGPAGRPASGADAQLIRDALWRHSNGFSCVEHISVTVLPAGIGVAIFLNHLAENPGEQAQMLLRITAHHSHVMSQWREATENRGELS